MTGMRLQPLKWSKGSTQKQASQAKRNKKIEAELFIGAASFINLLIQTINFDLPFWERA